MTSSSNTDDSAYPVLTRHPDRDTASKLTVLEHKRGGVAERLKAVVLKTTGPQGLAGSNPASSAIRLKLPRRGWTSGLDRRRCRPSWRANGTDAKDVAQDGRGGSGSGKAARGWDGKSCARTAEIGRA